MEFGHLGNHGQSVVLVVDLEQLREQGCVRKNLMQTETVWERQLRPRRVTDTFVQVMNQKEKDLKQQLSQRQIDCHLTHHNIYQHIIMCCTNLTWADWLLLYNREKCLL